MQIIEFIFSGKGLLPFRDLFDATEERKGHAVESSGKCELLDHRNGRSKVFGGAGTQPPEEKENHSQSYTGGPFMSTSPLGLGPLVYGDTPLGTRNCPPRSPLPSAPFLHVPVTFWVGGRLNYRPAMALIHCGRHLFAAIPLHPGAYKLTALAQKEPAHA